MAFATVYQPLETAGVKFDAPSLTQQQFKDEQDIGNMIRRALAGDMSVFNNPRYMDVLSAPETFHDAANKTALARTIWEDLPENIRATYGSPESLVLDYDRLLARNAAKDKEIADNLKVSTDIKESVAKATDGSTPSPAPKTT